MQFLSIVKRLELEYERSVEETREAVEFFPYFLSMLSTLAASRDETLYIIQA